MIIIADSGSTKCTWLFHEGGKTTSVRTRGINALQHTPEQIRETLAALPPCGPVSAVHIYSAGCSPAFPVSNEKLRRELEARFGAARIEVRSDLLGAARALFGRDEGIACILGHGRQFVPLPRRRGGPQRIGAGLRAGRRGVGCGAGPQPRERASSRNTSPCAGNSSKRAG